jgi:hypothetical protein
MSARAVPYPPPGYEVRIGRTLWASALATVREYAELGSERGRRGSEALVYLGGVVAADEMIVTGLYRLSHAPQGDRVVVTHEEARRLVQTLRARDEKLIGQLHSHRGLAGHSPGDDAWATSFHEGFLSIVVPGFGSGVNVPTDCAVLECRGGEFVDLDHDTIERRLNVYTEVTDLVEAEGVHHLAAREQEKRWRAFAARLKSIALKPR